MFPKAIRRIAAASIVGGGIGAVTLLLNVPEASMRRFGPAPPMTHLRPDGSPPTRADGLRDLRAHDTPETALDIFVVGAGATGSGVALDAAVRGMSVGLVDAADYAGATSSNSSKLLHGGVRYLEKAVFELDSAQLMLVLEALAERSVVLHQAPHLCRPLPTLVPCYSPFQLWQTYCGMKLYDLLAAVGSGTLAHAYRLGVADTLERFPMLKTEISVGGPPLQPVAEKRPLVGSVVYFDGQMNDARLNVSVALTAAAYGAAVANYTAATKIEAAGPRAGDGVATTRVTLRDETTGATFPVYAKCVVNAAGCFSDDVATMANADHVRRLAPATGAHVTIDKAYAPGDTALLVPKTSDGRVLFVIPWEGRVIAGTTDAPIEAVTRDLAPSTADVSFVLGTVASAVVVPKGGVDVRSAWVGVRPLALAGSDADIRAEQAERAAGRAPPRSTQAVVREHSVTFLPQANIVTVQGGKWTTYRRMAEDAVDACVKNVPSLAAFAGARCATTDVVVVGGDVENALATFHRARREAAATKAPAAAADASKTAAPTTPAAAAATPATVPAWEAAVGPEAAAQLRRSYGSRADALAAELLPLANAVPAGASATAKADAAARRKNCDRLWPTLPYIEAEVRHACRSEHAQTPGDVLSRRTRLGFLDATAAQSALARVADIMAEELRWGKKEKAAAVARAEVELACFFARPPAAAAKAA